MSNLNISIDLTRLPGAKVMDIQGKKSVRECVVIPIDNNIGTVCNGYPAQLPDGGITTKFFDDVKLNLVAIEYKQKKHGITHGLKPGFSKKMQESMTEEQMYNTPWLGTVKPWAQGAEEKQPDDDDLPEADDQNEW